MPEFTLTLLGAPTLATREVGEAVPPLGAKALALLAYLALERRPHSREALAGLLWGDSPEGDARASLRQALKHLRDAIGDLLHADRSLVSLDGPLVCDVTEFRAAAADVPASAARFDIPRFLAGFSVRHAPLFDEWVEATRSALLRQYHEAIGRAAREAMTQCQWREAAELADRWLASDPLTDAPAQLAIEARYLAGDRNGALARFTEYRALLRRETGSEPGAAMEALVRRVESDQAAPAARPVISDEWHVHAPTFEASLIGREVHWRALAAAWEQVREGRGRIVLVDGESGMGKSRLADEFLRWVVADGGTVLRGRSHERGGGIPYEPVVEVLREALGAPGLAGTAGEWLVEVGRLVPGMRERFPVLPDGMDPGEGWRLFEGVAQLLAALAVERPVAIAIDDLQWCEDDSCHLLRFLIRRLERSPVLWLCMLTPGEAEREAPASRLCRALRARSHAEVVTVGPLAEEQVWVLLRELGHLSAPNSGRRLAARLFRITAGNPFYLIELLKTMFAQGLLAMDGTSREWTVAPGVVGAGRHLPVSQSVQDVIAERVDRLPAELRDLLITVAVAGSCRPDMLSHVHGISRLHAASLGDALVDRHLVEETGGAYRCRHPIIAHVVRDGLTASRRQEVHRSLALSLELVLTRESAPDSAGELARHADRGGEHSLAYRYALVAAEAAIARFAYTEALGWLDLAGSSARGPEQSRRVDRLTADVLESAGLSEAPRVSSPLPITREIVSEDLDLPVRG